MVRKVDQDTSENSDSATQIIDHWIVSFEGDAEEHEVTEKYIGRLVESTDTESVKSGDNAAATASPASTPPSNNHRSNNRNNNNNKQSSRKKNSSKSPPRKASSSKDRAGGEARPSTRSAIKQGGKEKALLKGIKATKKPSSKKSKLGENETVVKVKMLTGTLYLYRGEHRRAEFVRTV